MFENCVLEKGESNCNGKDCWRCGWDRDVAKRRAKAISENKMTTGRDGLKRLIIKRKEILG